MEGERDAATTVEIALIKQLHATGLPVIITGDMNEHEEFFCRAATEARMVAANGGSGVGGCQLPPPPRRVDWIMGTTDVSFSGYVQDGASRAAASDHYLLYADVGLENDRAPAAESGPDRRRGALAWPHGRCDSHVRIDRRRHARRGPGGRLRVRRRGGATATDGSATPSASDSASETPTPESRAPPPAGPSETRGARVVVGVRGGLE